jgi:hypothetical protein
MVVTNEERDREFSRWPVPLKLKKIAKSVIDMLTVHEQVQSVQSGCIESAEWVHSECRVSA